MRELIRTRWAAIGAAVAVTLGAGGLSMTQAAEPTNGGPVYVSLAQPCRVIDTRPAPDNIGIAPAKIAAGESNAITVTVTGTNGNCSGIPAEAVGVAINLTAINNSTRSHFRVYPASGPLPLTANLNFGPGQTPLANKVDVGLSGGKFKIYNQAGTVDAAVDVFGYYINHNHDARYYTKPQVDAALAGKANAADVYTKAQVDADNAAQNNRLTDLENAVGQLTNSVAAFASSSDQETILTASEAVYQTVSIMPPADGVVVVNSQAYLRRADDFQVSVRCSISTTSAIDSDFYQLVTIPVSGIEDFENVSGTRGFDVTEGDLLTVNLVCTSFGEGTAAIGEPSLTAIFAPG